MHKYKIIGIGEILWDEFSGFKKLGGAPANFAFHASQLGADGMIISRVGDDLAGKEIKAILNDKRIPYLLSKDPLHPTGRVSVTTSSQNNPEYTIHEGAAWDHISFEPSFTNLANEADAISFGTLAQRNTVSGHSIFNFINATRTECIKIFDINLRQHYFSKTIISKLLQVADILKLNHDELNIVNEMFLNEKDETACLKELISMFDLDMIVLTKGKQGSRLFDKANHDSVYVPEDVKTIDSVGAGDSFSAAFAMGLLNGFKLDKINRIANSVASYVCTKKGATPEIPEKIIQSMN
jgi:fructokinase